MTHLEKQLEQIREKINEMWLLVEFQVFTGKDLLLNHDTDLAKKVIKKGKKVNSYDLKIDQLCKNFLALFNPVANDLRWILAVLKINANLERIGDSAEGIAWLLRDLKGVLSPELMEVSRVIEMYAAVTSMMNDARTAYEQGNPDLALSLMQKDKFLDKINSKADKILISYAQANPESIEQCFKLSGIIRKLERIGDQLTNIGEETIFYLDGRLMKHADKKK